MEGGGGATQEVCINQGHRERLTAHVSIGASDCRDAVWVNSNTLRCRAVPPGVGHALVVRASVAAQVGYLTQVPCVSYRYLLLATVT